ncbi:MAG: AraC family transcriptional regulator [Motiliproteus sp.]
MSVQLSNNSLSKRTPSHLSDNASIVIVGDGDSRVEAGSYALPLYRIQLCADAEGRVQIGDYQGRCGPGSLFLLAPNIPYRWLDSSLEVKQDVNSGWCISFSAAWIQRMVQIIPELDALPALLQRAHQGLQFSGDTLHRAQPLLTALVVADGAQRLVLFLQLLGCLSDCDEAQSLSAARYGSLNRSKSQSRIDEVVEFVRLNFDQDLSLSSVASNHAMSANHLSRLFKQATGSGFCDFLTELRIRRACELLSCSDLPITDICFDTGFKNISNFNRRFTALKQSTPSEYRRACWV